jgi:hypothetical protein
MVDLMRAREALFFRFFRVVVSHCTKLVMGLAERWACMRPMASELAGDEVLKKTQCCRIVSKKISVLSDKC